ncbi:rubrerythrin family protein [Halobellus ordinarius]|uniref:rubrerythrin family protein n=1 Tax=Halobellus ordinarius TaxID=3075120 RepID=UPI0028809FD1|nr:rubrerythrin family protein [Halobellus sp. ZY16]
MDTADLRSAVETAKETELDRLSSSKLLLALTDAELDRESVLRAAAASELAARETFSTWADDEEHDAAADLFADVADQEQRHYERVADLLGEEIEPPGSGPMHGYLRERAGTVDRLAGGLLGRTLVSDRTHLQVVSFFVNEADEAAADVFRELRTETREAQDRGLDLLDTVCETEEDWETAEAVASYVIQLAYDDYTDVLVGMGVDPKPIC